METVPRLDEDERCVTRDEAVDGFFEVLRREQSSLLESARQAASVLRERSDLLPSLVARHLRLIQLFLDAQRALLVRTVEVEREVTRFGGNDVAAQTLARAEDRERQLAKLLDGWWSAEVAHGQTMIAVATTSAHDPHDSIAPVLAALDAVDPADLDPLLAALAVCFEPAPSASPEEATAMPALAPAPNEDRDDTFERFWSSTWLGTSLGRNPQRTTNRTSEPWRG